MNTEKPETPTIQGSLVYTQRGMVVTPYGNLSAAQFARQKGSK